MKVESEMMVEGEDETAYPVSFFLLTFLILPADL